MKKLCLILIASLSLSTLTGFNFTDKLDKEGTILWKESGKLAPQKGQSENIGTAGILYGTLGEYIIVGGGANFPNESVLDGGEKRTYPDVYLLKENEKGNFEVVNQIQLPFEIGYGSSITTDKGVYYIGGSTDKDHANDITLFTQSNGKIEYKKVGDLPFTFSDGIAVEKDNIIYIGFGKQDGKSSNRFLSYNLNDNFIKELNTLTDGSTRNQAVAQVLGDNIYLFSGGGDTINTDGYKYSIKDNAWEKVARVSVNGKQISLYGASSVKLNNDEMLVIGGFDKTVYDNAVRNLTRLREEELEAYRQKYFKMDIPEYNWNKEMLVYNAKENNWKSIGKIPFNAPCGAGLVQAKDKVVLINGEIKPGVRDNVIYTGLFVK